jgi:hypothetical protein
VAYEKTCKNIGKEQKEQYDAAALATSSIAKALQAIVE